MDDDQVLINVVEQDEGESQMERKCTIDLLDVKFDKKIQVITQQQADTQ